MTIISEDYYANIMRDAFEEANAQDIPPQLAMFIPAVKQITEVLNSHGRITAKLTGFYARNSRQAPKKIDISAYDKKRTFKGSYHTSLYDAKSLELTYTLQNTDFTDLMHNTLRQDKTSCSFCLYLIEHGAGNIRWAEGVNEYHDPNDAIDPFSEEAAKRYLEIAGDSLANAVKSAVHRVKEEHALGIETVKPLSPLKHVVKLK